VAQESSGSVTDLSRAVEDIAHGAADQAVQVQGAGGAVGRMAAGIEQVAADASRVALGSQEAKQAALHGVEAVQQALAGMTEVQHVVDQAVSTVSALGDLGTTVGAVVETIDDIAEQTNLLALNAAIEAARAGEHGRGFAVVAGEVRKLAERSSRETRQVRQLIQEIQVGTRRAVETMDLGALTVRRGAADSQRVGQALEEILRAVEATVVQVSRIASASHDMASSAGNVTAAMDIISVVVEGNRGNTEAMRRKAAEVTTAMDGIAAVAAEQSASTHGIAMGVEDMSRRVEQMDRQAAGLAATAERLGGVIARFALTEERIEPTPLRRAA
jgi:methyl-accepting chemotaxis protein